MIQIDHFCWRFADADESALHDVNLGIQPGDFVVVAGPSGSGKTTLALAMCGLLVGRHDGHSAGTVRVDGLDVAVTPLPEVAQRIALVQQNPEAQFATLTVSDEVAFGLENRCVSPDEIRRRSTDAMNLLGVTHLRDRSLATLSGGEQQRVAIASIMAGNPSAVVLDEPTASLDPQAARDFFRVLADLCHSQGLTVIVIEHKLAQLRPHRPRLIRLVAGSVAREIVFEYPLAASLSAEPQSHSRSTLDERDGNVGCPASPIPNPILTSDATTVVHGAQSPAPRLAELANITVSLGGRKVLDNVSLAISPGDVIAILGPNGSGKTTLLHCLLGLVKPDAGSVSACGSTVTPCNVSSRVVDVGVVLQNADHQLVADSVIEEAVFTTRTLGLWTRDSVSLTDHCVRLLEQAGILNRRDDHPYRLSWGQKRRLNLISAVLHRPQLLLLDEPFAGQDWDNAEFLLNVIRTVVAGVPDEVASRSPPAPRGACLLVTHDSRFVARGCTRVVFVSEGCILLDAPLPDALTRLREMKLDAYLPDEPAC